MTQINQKYELLDDDTVTTPDGRTLKRVRYLIAIAATLWSPAVNPGDLGGYAEKVENVSIEGNACILGDARIEGNARIWGDARILGNARIEKRADIFWTSNVGSEYGTLTVYKGKDNQLLATRGCFGGTLAEFEEAVEERHKGQIRNEYKLLIQFAKLRLGESNEISQ